MAYFRLVPPCCASQAVHTGPSMFPACLQNYREGSQGSIPTTTTTITTTPRRQRRRWVYGSSILVHRRRRDEQNNRSIRVVGRRGLAAGRLAAGRGLGVVVVLLPVLAVASRLDRVGSHDRIARPLHLRTIDAFVREERRAGPRPRGGAGRGGVGGTFGTLASEELMMTGRHAFKVTNEGKPWQPDVTPSVVGTRARAAFVLLRC